MLTETKLQRAASGGEESMTDVHKPAQGAAQDRGSRRAREPWGIPRLTGQDLSYHPSEGAGPAWRWWPHSVKRLDHQFMVTEMK